MDEILTGFIRFDECSNWKSAGSMSIHFCDLAPEAGQLFALMALCNDAALRMMGDRE